jgi:hypothetical protein
MATMTIRTTVAFDPATVARWERLSKKWGVSKSEALRRALENAESQRPDPSLSPELTLPTLDEIATMTPQQALSVLRSHPLVSKTAGEKWRATLRETREDFAERP